MKTSPHNTSVSAWTIVSAYATYMAIVTTLISWFTLNAHSTIVASLLVAAVAVAVIRMFIFHDLRSSVSLITAGAFASAEILLKTFLRDDQPPPEALSSFAGMVTFFGTAVTMAVPFMFEELKLGRRASIIASAIVGALFLTAINLYRWTGKDFAVEATWPLFLTLLKIYALPGAVIGAFHQWAWGNQPVWITIRMNSDYQLLVYTATEDVPLLAMALLIAANVFCIIAVRQHPMSELGEVALLAAFAGIAHWITYRVILDVGVRLDSVRGFWTAAASIVFWNMVVNLGIDEMRAYFAAALLVGAVYRFLWAQRERIHAEYAVLVPAERRIRI